MSQPETDRLVADMDGGFVVYINGMRLNKLRAVPQWLMAGRKIAKMLDRLEADPDSGFLGYEPALMGLRTGAAIQYWRSLADLKRFAHDHEDLHVPAWTWYDEQVSDGGGVGFWSELYVVGEDDYETFFRNIDPVGLGRFATLVPTDPREPGLDPSGDPADGSEHESVSDSDTP